MVFNSGLLTLLCFLVLLSSYAVIMYRVHRSSSEGKNKALSTCTTHLIIILIMFGPAIFIYTRPFRTLPVDKVVSFFHTVIIPLLNPVIYTFRNQEVKSAVWRFLSQYVVCWMDCIISQNREVGCTLFVHLTNTYFLHWFSPNCQVLL